MLKHVWLEAAWNREIVTESSNVVSFFGHFLASRCPHLCIPEGISCERSWEEIWQRSAESSIEGMQLRATLHALAHRSTSSVWAGCHVWSIGPRYFEVFLHWHWFDTRAIDAQLFHGHIRCVWQPLFHHVCYMEKGSYQNPIQLLAIRCCVTPSLQFHSFTCQKFLSETLRLNLTAALLEVGVKQWLCPLF